MIIMFLIKADIEQRREWKQTIKKNDEAFRFYNELMDGKYDIYFSYRPDDQVLIYEALPKENDGKYASLVVDIRRVVSNLAGTMDTPRVHAFACYLCEKDSEKSEAELKEIYGSLYETLAPLAMLSTKDAQERKSSMPLFLQLTREILQDDHQEHVDKIQLEYLIEVDSYDDCESHIRLRVISNNRARLVKKPQELLKAAFSSVEVEFANIYLTLSPESFSDKDLQALRFLASRQIADYRYSYRYYDDDITLDGESLCDLLHILKGTKVVFDDKTTKISPEVIKAKVAILADGSFNFEPSVSGIAFFHDTKCAIADQNKNNITLLEFNNQKEMKLYQFSYEHPDFRFELFQNEISASIVPMVEDSVSVANEFKEKHPTQKDEICYYVTYTDKDTLSFRSEFLRNKEVVSQSIFVSSLPAERKFYQFEDALEELHLPQDGEISSPSEIIAFLKKDISPLQKAAKVMLSEELANKKVSGVGKINIRMNSQIDWLNLEVASDTYTSEELDKILAAYKKKKKYIRLRDHFISFDEEDSQSFFELVDDFNLTSVERERLPIYDALKLSTYSDNEFSVLYSKEIKDLFDDIKHFKDEKLVLPDNMLKNLRNYQLDGVKWLHVLARHNLSGILADDMGLGKTLEMISLIASLKATKPVLIVSPKSLIYNWENEFRKWNPEAKVFVLDGDKNSRNVVISNIDNSKGDIYVTSYDSLRNDVDLMTKYSFSLVVLDEAQSIANVYAKKTRAVKEIQSDHKFVLTGTPIQNSLLDLWSVFDFLMPGYLPSFKNFSAQYGKLTIDDQEMKKILMKKVAPFVLKRTKKEVLKDLPPKEEQVLTVNMSDKQRELYDAYIQRARNALNDPESNKIAILAEITRLREICVDPSMFIENFLDESAKLQVAVEQIKMAIENGHKVIAFSSFAKTLFHLKEMLGHEKIASYMIYGDTKAKDRIMMAEDFNTKEEVKVMLVSLKAGGTGLNLVGADIVIHLDPWWNLAAENQASDRAHRIGQKRSVTVIKMVCKNSIEERVIELQEKKKELTSVISEGDEGITSINTEDLRFLLE